MLVPQSLGYAALAGMSSVDGLYAAVGALVIYWMWGSSRGLNVGPESTVAIVVPTILAPRAAMGSEEYIEVATNTDVLLDAEAISDIDSTGVQVLVELLDRLDQRNVGLAMAWVKTEIQDELVSAGIVDRIAGEGICLEVDDGVAALLRPTASTDEST